MKIPGSMMGPLEAITHSPWKEIPFHRYFKPLILAGVLILAAFLGMDASPFLVVILVALLAGLIAVEALTHQPMWGVVALLLGSMLIRREIDTGTNVGISLTMIILAFLIGLWLARMLLIDKEIRLIPARVNLPALAFIAATTLSLAVANVPWIINAPQGANFGAQIGSWLIYVLSITFFLWMIRFLPDRKWLRRLVWFFLALGSVYIASRIFPSLSFLRWEILAHTRGYGSMFWVWYVTLSFGQLLVNNELKPAERGLMAVLLVGALFSAMFQTRTWLSGWVPALVAILVIAWLYNWRLGLFLTLCGGAYVMIQSPTLVSNVLNPVEQYSIESRAATYPIMFQLIDANPILGLGLANYYHFTQMYPILGWYVKFNSHNNYMDLIAQTGLVGLGIFLWLAFEIGRVGWRLRPLARDGFSRAYVYSTLGGLVAMLISGFMGDWFLPFIYNIGIYGMRASIYAWLFLGGLIALDRILRQEQGELRDEPND